MSERMDPELKCIAAIVRAILELNSWEARVRVMKYILSRWPL